MNPTDQETLRNRAAAYVRMSTDHQQYSTINQMDFIREDARHRGLEIVKMFSDEGKSGLNFEGRDALKAMIAEIEAGQANYCCILVYDVSRGGRYQDPDESAHYEYICRKAGVAVHYCAEPFENDGSPMSALVKSFTYVEALILGTPKDQINEAEKPKKPKGLSAENIGRMKEEMELLERDLKAIEAGYGENVLNLTLARAYVRKLLNNPAVARFLSTHYADISAEFTTLAAAESL